MEDLALSAYFHLIVPISLDLPLTDRPADKPTEVPALELPGRTLLFYLYGAVLNVPAGFASILSFLHGQKE